MLALARWMVGCDPPWQMPGKMLMQAALAAQLSESLTRAGFFDAIKRPMELQKCPAGVSFGPVG